MRPRRGYGVDESLSFSFCLKVLGVQKWKGFVCRLELERIRYSRFLGDSTYSTHIATSLF